MLVVLSWLSAPPAGLVDVAQREALRREATQKSQASLTNLGMPPEGVPPSAVSMPPAETAAPVADPAAKPTDAAAAKPGPPREESWWRKKMAELRSAVDRDESAANALQSRINTLQADAVNIDDPIKQTKARMDLVKAIDDLDKTKKQVDADRRAIADLQDEARRLSIPAGWLR
jgi:septal ring factor EnvC (AmiA/AmiB activator)